MDNNNENTKGNNNESAASRNAGFKSAITRLEKARKQLDGIQNNCSHEMVLFLGTRFDSDVFDVRTTDYHICLICGTKNFKKGSLKSENVIDVSDYKKEWFLFDEALIQRENQIKEIFEETRSFFPKLPIDSPMFKKTFIKMINAEQEKPYPYIKRR